MTLLDKTQHTGLLKTVTDTHIVISQIVIEREGKKKKEVEVETPVSFEQIEKTIVKLKF